VSAWANYWRAYDATLNTIRAERPSTFAGVKLILDRFSAPSSGDAFFPGGADDTLADALRDAGWDFDWDEADYLYTARHPLTGARLRYIEGDIFDDTTYPEDDR